MPVPTNSHRSFSRTRSLARSVKATQRVKQTAAMSRRTVEISRAFSPAADRALIKMLMQPQRMPESRTEAAAFRFMERSLPFWMVPNYITKNFPICKDGFLL